MESVSDDELLVSKMSATSKQIKKFKINAMNTTDVVLSDTFDDEYGSDSDYLSSDDQQIDDLSAPTATSEFDLEHKLILHKKKKLLISSSRPQQPQTDKSDKTGDGELELEESDTASRRHGEHRHSNKTESGSFLTLPIDEDDEDNYEEVVQRVHVQPRSHGHHAKPKRHGHSHKRMKSQMTTMKELKEAEREDTSQSEAGSQSQATHARSYSESNLRRGRSSKRVRSDSNGRQWSSEESDDSQDVDGDQSSQHSHSIKQRYMSMKKKYRKQRRISRQFQDAITSIQDDNEEDIIATEQQLREHYEKEYELKMLQLEHQKLNNEMKNDDKMKHILLENEELMMQNKQLQQQIAAQVAMIQQHQEMALQQTQTFVRMQSGDSILSPMSNMHSPMAALGQFPPTPTRHHPGLRRVSSASTVSTSIMPSGPGLGIIPSENCNNARSHSVDINAATTSNLAFGGSTPNLFSASFNSMPMLTCNVSATPIGNGNCSKNENGTPSVASQDDNYTLHLHATGSQDSNGSDEFFGSEATEKSNQSNSNQSSRSIHSGNAENKDAVMNMEPPKRRKTKKSHKKKGSHHHHHHSHSSKKKAANSKRRKLQDLETRLLEKDEEIRDKIGDAMTPWDRFLELMTPSFCSCSPAPQQVQKVIGE